MTAPSPSLIPRRSWAETRRISEILRKETVGGALLLVATVVALVWANSPASDSYAALRDLEVDAGEDLAGPERLVQAGDPDDGAGRGRACRGGGAHTCPL